MKRLSASRGRQGERGAVAVITGLLMIVVIGLGAFTVDLGMAYADTRQLQTSADAAALAAANVFRNVTTAANCDGIRTSAAATTAVQAARDIRAENRPSSTEASYATVCTGGSLEVTYSSRGSTPTFLGGLFGRSSDYDKVRTAKARLSVLSSGIIRPYAVCASQLNEAPVGTVLQMDLPSTGNAACPGAANSGNWWSVDCPEVGSNSNSYMAAATLNGCAAPVTVVANQQATPARTPAQLRAHLESSCTSRSSSCLSANTGALNGTIIDSWDVLVNEQRRVILPVFCGVAPAGKCDTAAVVNAGGNNAIYPVHALLGVQICGYHFGNKQKPDSPGLPGGECATHNPSALSTNPGNSQTNYILMRVVDVATLPTGGSTGCQLGAPCDLQRTVSLVE